MIEATPVYSTSNGMEFHSWFAIVTSEDVIMDSLVKYIERELFEGDNPSIEAIDQLTYPQYDRIFWFVEIAGDHVFSQEA